VLLCACPSRSWRRNIPLLHAGADCSSTQPSPSILLVKRQWPERTPLTTLNNAVFARCRAASREHGNGGEAGLFEQLAEGEFESFIIL